MKRLLCRIFAVMALVAGIVTPSAGLAFADPSTDTTVAPVPTVPPVPTAQVQTPVVPVIPTPGVGPPVAPAPQVPVVVTPAPVPVPAPQPVPPPAPVVAPVVPTVAPQPVPVKAPDPVPPQPAPVVTVPPAPVTAPAPAPVVEQPIPAPKPVIQPAPAPIVVPPVQPPKPVTPPASVTAPAPPVVPVPPVKSEAPQITTVDRPVPSAPPVAVDTGPVPANQPPSTGRTQLPPPAGPNEVSPVEGSDPVVVPHDAGVGARSVSPLPEVAVQTSPAINQNITNTTIDVPRQLPPPAPSNPFPSWGYNQPVEVQPVPFPVHNGQQGGGSCNTTQNCNNNPGPVGGSCGNPPCSNPGPPGGGCSTQPCNNPGPSGNCGSPPCGNVPPPIIPDHPVYNPWQNGNHHTPPPNPDIFVRGDDNGQVVFVNNVTQINNTSINNAPVTVYLTNFDTNRVLSFNSNYGTPNYLSPGWCGGLGGSWGWSANANVLGFGASFAGGGSFNVGPGCGYIPPPMPPVNPLPIYSPGYPPVYASNYSTPQGCGCIYADNTYLYGNYQQVPIQGVPQQAFVPTSYTPDIMFQQPTAGLPPFMTGDDPVSTNWFAKQPAILWVSVGIVMLGLTGLAYVNREHLMRVFG